MTSGFDSEYVASSPSRAVITDHRCRKERSDSLKENRDSYVAAEHASIATAILATSVIASAAIPIVSSSGTRTTSEDGNVGFLPPDTSPENTLLVSYNCQQRVFVKSQPWQKVPTFLITIYYFVDNKLHFAHNSVEQPALE